MMRCLLMVVLAASAAAGEAEAQESLLGKVPKLQETARRANAGALGCGFGKVTLITSRGQLDTFMASDPIHVFGRTIRVSDLLPLLEARAEANRSGAENPMSGEVGDLTYVILYTLSRAKDPDSIPVIAELLKDKGETIRGWAAIALYEIAESGEELRAKIKEIRFPQPAVDSAKARSTKPPAWVQIAPGN
jgi:hypothetical protein